MRIAFAGTPEFAATALRALLSSKFDVVGVFTQPDRPAGRGRKLTASPVSVTADAAGIPLFKPEKFDADAQLALRNLDVDIFVVAAYGLILPQAALDIPKRYCLNIHASLLPRWRGAAPIQRAIEVGDKTTGITIMQMEAGLDTGPMLLKTELIIGNDETSGELHDRLALSGANAILSALKKIESGDCVFTQQPDGASYAKKLSKEEARVDWEQPAEVISRSVRAFNPVPVAWTELAGERVRVFSARPAKIDELSFLQKDNSNDSVGTIKIHGSKLFVVCGKKADAFVEILSLQKSGAKVQSAADFINALNQKSGNEIHDYSLR